MKNKLVKMLTMMLVAGSVLTACGGEEEKAATANPSADVAVNQTVVDTVETEPETEPESEVPFDEYYYNKFRNGIALVDGEYMGVSLCLYNREVLVGEKYKMGSDLIREEDESYVIYTKFRLRTKDEIIMITEDGQEELWVYDADNGTVTVGEVTFYGRRADFFKKEVPESEYLLSGTYVGTYHGTYSTPYALSKEGDYGVEFVFNEDGSAHATIDGEWGFCAIEKYSIQGNQIIALTYEEILLAGEIDEATGKITLAGVEYTKVQ